MFCNGCGSNIKDGTVFCPKCGQRLKKLPEESRAFTSAVPNAPQKQLSVLQIHKKAVIVVAGIVVILLILILAISKRGSGEDREAYSLVGIWTSEDAVNLENAVSKLLSEEAGLPDWAIDTVMELTGISYLSDVTVTFDEYGGLRVGGGGIAVTVGTFSYEKINDNTLSLKYALDVPIVGEVSIAYQAKYSLGKDRLTLDLFGVKAKFRRQE